MHKIAEKKEKRFDSKLLSKFTQKYSTINVGEKFKCGECQNTRNFLKSKI